MFLFPPRGGLKMGIRKKRSPPPPPPHKLTQPKQKKKAHTPFYLWGQNSKTHMKDSPLVGESCASGVATAIPPGVPEGEEGAYTHAESTQHIVARWRGPVGWLCCAPRGQKTTRAAIATAVSGQWGGGPWWKSGLYAEPMRHHRHTPLLHLLGISWPVVNLGAGG